MEIYLIRVHNMYAKFCYTETRMVDIVGDSEFIEVNYLCIFKCQNQGAIASFVILHEPFCILFFLAL